MAMDDNETRDQGDRLEPEGVSPVVPVDEHRAGVPWGGMMLLIWAVALIVFSVQNAEDTTVTFLNWEWDMPVALLVMVTALATLVLTGVGSAIYRRQRRRRAQLRATARSAASDEV
jgi:uncharacterized integral membrane protein